MYRQIRNHLNAEGELPLLNGFQQRFLDEVNEVLDRRVNESASLYPEYAGIQNVEIFEVISATETHLMIFIERLRSSRSSIFRFVEVYPCWGRKRKDCTEKLTEIADSINTDRFNCNVAKLVGHSAAFVGGGMTITSAILIPFTLGLTTPFAVAGGSLIFAGCGTTAGTSITETALLKSKVEQAKKLIKEDEEYFKYLAEGLTHASDLQEALQSILGTAVLRKVADSTKKFVQESVKISNDRERLNNIQRFITENLRDDLPEELPITAIAKFIMVLVTIFLLLINTDNRVTFDFASITIRSILGVASLIDNSMDILSLSSLMPGSAAAAKNLAKAVTRGGVAVVGMALDVIGIVFISKDIHAGSLSPEAEKIKDAVKEMREEALVLANIYNNLVMYINNNEVRRRNC